MKRSNLIKNLSGDKKLNFIQKIIWLVIAYLNFFLEYTQIDSRIHIYYFKPNKLNTFSKKKIPTPSRYWCDLFWHFLVEKNFFLKKIQAVEVGCGTGIYGKFLKDHSRNFNNYLGIDIAENQNWSSYFFKNFNFIKDDCYKIDKYINDKNFLFTQSSLEHFKYDLSFHETIKKKLDTFPLNKKFFQLHLFPSYQCISTYLFHGYRHFDLRTISKVARIYDGNVNTNFFVIKLGSKETNNLHFNYITFSRFSNIFKDRSKNASEYLIELDKAVKIDAKFPQKKNVAFYALLIFSNYDKKELESIKKSFE